MWKVGSFFRTTFKTGDACKGRYRTSTYNSANVDSDIDTSDDEKIDRALERAKKGLFKVLKPLTEKEAEALLEDPEFLSGVDEVLDRTTVHDFSGLALAILMNMGKKS